MAGGFFRSLVDRFRGRPVDWEEFEESLLRADLGVPLTLRIIEELQRRPWGVDAGSAVELASREILAAFPPPPPPLRPLHERPAVILMVGVNGTGKTTSTAKLAKHLRDKGHTCLLAAADTFRAAAIEQLEMWGARLGVEVVKSHYGGDPAALCHDAWTSAQRRKMDFLLCDTAGRLHTKGNLMAELAKVTRTLAKHDSEAPHERLLVVDSGTGANALVQAREFHAAVQLTGIVLTKLDGSGKGGVAAAIGAELSIPTRFVGTGEGIEDFAPFEAERFVGEML